NYSIHKISFAEIKQLEYTYINLQGEKITKSINDAKGGMTTSFVAENSSVQVVTSSNDKYSIIPLRPYYNKHQTNKIKRLIAQQSNDSNKSDGQKKTSLNPINNNKDKITNKNKNPNIKSRIKSDSRDPEICDFFTSGDIISGLFPQIDQVYSPLGTTKSISSGAGGSLGVGVSIFIPAEKLKGNLGSAQAAIGGSYENSYTLVSKVDIDGDGYQDLVLRHMDGHFRYRKHIVTNFLDSDGEEVIQHSFEPSKVLLSGEEDLDLTDLEIGYSESFTYDNPNITGTLALGPFGVHLGKNTSTTVSENSVFFTDGNGDGLMDISYNGVVLFNYLNEEGIPTFTTSSEPTENMILTGFVAQPEDLVPDIVDEVEAKFPAFDVVKVWRAPADGHIVINNLGTLPIEVSTVSIETDVNAFYSRYCSQTDKTGTCRLYHGDLSTIDPSISSLITNPGCLDCYIYNVQDSCQIDSDRDGINDCLDPCPFPEDQVDCEPCQNEILISDPVISDPETGEIISEKEAELKLTAINLIESGNEAIYHAGNEIRLGRLVGEEFTVEDGGELLAYIGPCNEGSGNDIGGDGEDPPPLTQNLRVQKGQNIYFRMHATEPFEEANWDPEVVYTDVIGFAIDADEIVDSDGLPYYKNRYSKDFNTSGTSPRIIPAYSGSNAGSAVTITWPTLDVGGLSDDVTFIINKIVTSQKVVKSKIEANGSEINILVPDEQISPLLSVFIPRGASESVSGQNTSTNNGVVEITDIAEYDSGTGATSSYAELQAIEVDEDNPTYVGAKHTSYDFKIVTKSNIDWESIDWNPLLKYAYTETIDLEVEEYTEDFEIKNSFYPIVNKDIYATYAEEFDYTKPADIAYNNVKLNPEKYVNTLYFTFNKEVVKDLLCPDVEGGDGKDADWCQGELTAVIKQNGKAIGHQGITLKHNGDGKLDPPYIAIPVNFESDKTITVEIYGDNEFLSQEAMEHMNSIPHTSHKKDDYIGFISSKPGKFNPKKNYVEGLNGRDCNFYIKSNDLYGPMYRNWGQFFYNEKADVDENTPQDDVTG
ncbi:MAG: hypothetical protein ACJATI_005625, partial [Halioglobus sp.]